ncbi:MAG: hypothetical protein DRR11_05590 [Gammaproteobacteria bacterium]|nr:MAG: hypothetical protein DRR15_19325 [Gammaproteobacteria bacterium]RLA33428.1 MAG: hypothetical protein DRR11_05590 [Gammaproteobacteria bacterium]
MQALAKTSLLLVLVLVTLSAYLRLDHSGIGCEPWPACYGNIGIADESPTAASAYERLLEEASQPLSWARPLHRFVASVLGLAILGLCLLSLNRKKDRLLSLGLLALTVFLAWLGIYSEGLNSPAVVMGNLAGGFAMLGLLGWMVLRKPHPPDGNGSSLQKWASAAIVVLCLQILLGGLTSANFAASACQTIPDCHGSWLPGTEIAAAFDLSGTHTISDAGMVLGGAERAAIHKLHRLVAVLTAVIVLIAGTVAIRSGADLRMVGGAAMLLVVTEFSLGVSAILTSLPIGIAVAHNWIAALLLLGLLKLLAESRVAGLGIRG